jgi:Cu+-exporting ATPase
MELVVAGMTCASCVVRVEKQLNRLPGVAASVNLATETATVSHPESITADDLIRAIRQAGYTAAVPAATAATAPAATTTTASGAALTPTTAPPAATPAATAAVARPPLRLVVSVLLAVPVALLAMVPALRFDGISGPSSYSPPR